jgi:hypothetical protein
MSHEQSLVPLPSLWDAPIERGGNVVAMPRRHMQSGMGVNDHTAIRQQSD